VVKFPKTLLVSFALAGVTAVDRVAIRDIVPR